MPPRGKSRDDRITWRQADAQALPFEDAAFDLVCCQFGAMFFPDRPSAYREARRVLKPGGCFLFNAWDRIEENVFADDVTERARGIFPERSAALPGAHAARLSRHRADPRAIWRRRAFTDVTIETRAEAEPRALAARPSRSPIARARRCATRSKPAAPTNSRPPPITPRPPSHAARQRRGRRQDSGACHSGACMIPVCARGWRRSADQSAGYEPPCRLRQAGF